MMDGFDATREVEMSEPTDVALAPHHDDYQSWTSTWYGPDRKPNGKLRRHTARFGKDGEVTAKQARAAFRRWLEKTWRPRYARKLGEEVGTCYTVADLTKDYWTYAQKVYKKNGKGTTHLGQVKRAMEQLGDAYGTTVTTDFTNPMLAKLRDQMLADGKYPRDGKRLTVRTVNGRLTIIKQAFKWAREKSLVDKATIADVLAVSPLKVGRCEARETDDVRPVSREIVDATLKVCGQGLRDMVELQWLTGMRPGEVCHMRPGDVDRKGEVWVYTPHTHKTEHKEKSRRIAIGPQAQTVLAKYMMRAPASYCFITSACLFPDGSGPGRLTPKRPMYADRYLRFIWYACDKAGVELWKPNQLRHSWATRMRERYGIEAASDGLGHSSVDITEIYAERSLKRAIDVAKEVG
jgi:integrase